MKHDLFMNLLGKLSNWCNKKLNEVQKDIYWDEIHKIPDLAFEDIIGNLIKNTPPSGKLPTPDEISLQWFSWLTAHPEYKAIEYPQIECHECNGVGLFTVWYQAIILPKDQMHQGDDLNKYKSWCKMFLPCSQCQNWKREFSTRGDNRPTRFYTQQSILEKGWRLTDPYWENFKKRKKEIPVTKDLGYLTKQTFSDFPEEKPGDRDPAELVNEFREYEAQEIPF